MGPNLLFPENLVTFTEEILMETSFFVQCKYCLEIVGILRKGFNIMCKQYNV